MEGEFTLEVVIVGAGAIGMLIGSYLAEANHQVTFVVQRKEQADILHNEGLHRQKQNGVVDTFAVRATTDLTVAPSNALWIIAVKYYALPPILQRLEQLSIEAPVLFVQNGIGHFAIVEQSTIAQPVIATVEHGAQRINDNTIIHNGVGPIRIGEGQSTSDFLSAFVAVNKPQFPIIVAQNAFQLLLRKTLLNCMINPLTAILQVQNGQLIHNAYCKQIVQQLFEELSTAFHTVEPAIAWQDVEKLCLNTAKNTSSMLADRKQRRPMEVETIVTAVRELAESEGYSLPLLATLERMLYALNEKEGHG